MDDNNTVLDQLFSKSQTTNLKNQILRSWIQTHKQSFKFRLNTGNFKVKIIHDSDVLKNAAG